MKKVAFAWLTFWYDFSTKEEAEKFRDDNQGKYWLIDRPYENNNNNGFPYTVEVKKPYGKYNPGW